MDPERLQRIRQIYLSAASLEPGQRSSFLAHACQGDASLRKEVESLLLCQDEGVDFIERPAMEIAAQVMAGEKGNGPSKAMIGRSLAHYRIVEEIGSGGMGVVYRAHDSHLNRLVALKVLPPGLTGDPERKKRFVQEARAASALNHPNIVTIYDISSVDATDYIAMEFVAGKTLAHLIGDKGLSLVDTLTYTTQIAYALARAHKAGIIHRDLKPANIMVTEEGLVKVMDFGLAKLIHPGAEDSGTSTVSSGLETMQGIIAGTPAYMSPEQALGQPVDARSDIFSIGIIIFQCLSGHLPFEHAPGRSYKMNLLWGPPLQLRTLVPNTPEDLERIVLRCLEKDPSKRFDSAGDLARELEVVFREFTLASKNEARREPDTRRRRRRNLTIALLLMVCLGLLVTTWMYRNREGESRIARNPAKWKPLITWPSDEYGSRISPDGKWISFISNRRGQREIWLLNLSGADPIPLPSSSGSIISQSWSPAGDKIAFLVQSDSRVFLQIIPAFFGGAPQETQEVDRACGRLIRWIGDHIYLEAHGSILRFNIKTKVLQQVTTHQDPSLKYVRHFDVRRDELKIVFTAYEGGAEDLWVADLDGTNQIRLTNDPASDVFPLWIGPKGPDIVFQSSRGGQLNMCVASSENRSIRQITFGAFAVTPEDISTDGSTLVFREIRDTAHLWSLDPKTGHTRQMTADSLSDFWPSASSTAGTIAFQRRMPSAQIGYNYLESQILVGGWSPNGIQNPRMLVDNGYAPRLSPDGRWMAFLKWITTDSKYSELWAVETNSQRRFRITGHCPVSGVFLFPLDFLSTDFVWSSDSRILCYIDQNISGLNEIRRVDMESPGAKPELLISSRDGERITELNLSKDDSCLSYLLERKGDSDQTELHVLELDSRQDRVIYSASQRRAELFYSRGWLESGKSMVVLPATSSPDGTQTVGVIEVTLSGMKRQLADFPRAFGATARLDPLSQNLYLTMAEGIVHNVYALSIPDRKVRRLTDNPLPGVSFSGIEILAGGKLLYSRHEHHGDIWTLRFGSQ